MNRRKFLGFLGIAAVSAPVLALVKPKFAPKPVVTGFQGTTGDITLTTGQAASHNHTFVNSDLLPSHKHILTEANARWSAVYVNPEFPEYSPSIAIAVYGED